MLDQVIEVDDFYHNVNELVVTFLKDPCFQNFQIGKLLFNFIGIVYGKEEKII